MSKSTTTNVDRTLVSVQSLEDSEFLNALYEMVLGRKPDAPGYTYYLNRLRHGDTKKDIIFQILRSPEAAAARSKRRHLAGTFSLLISGYINHLPLLWHVKNAFRRNAKLLGRLVATENTIQEQLNTQERRIRTLEQMIASAPATIVNAPNPENLEATDKISSRATSGPNSSAQPLSRLILLSMVKNEADIVEAFVRHNCIFFDRIIILDNGSTDGTREILHSLQAEGLPLTIEDDVIPGYTQREKMTARYRDLVKSEPFDFLVILDADEFIKSNDRNELRTRLQDKATKYYLAWHNYVPIPPATGEIADPLRSIRYRNRRRTLRKVAIPNFGALGDFVEIWQGNHDFDFPPQSLHFELLPVSLAHFPVRSIEQIEAKCTVGWLSYAVKSKTSHWSHEGLQWRVMFERLMDAPLTANDLAVIADCYSNIEDADFNEGIDQTALILDPVTPNYGPLRYKGASTPAIAKLAKFCEQIIRLYWQNRDELTQLKADSVRSGVPLTAEPKRQQVDASTSDSRREAELISADAYIWKGEKLPSGAKSILFVSDLKHLEFQTLRYRCFNLIDYLKTAGWNCAVAFSEQAALLSLENATPAIVVFIRTAPNETILSLVRHFRTAGSKIVFDIDDFVFDDIIFLQKLTVPGIAKIPELLNSEWARPYRQEAAFYRQMMEISDAVTTTTSYLCEKARAHNRRCFVIKNSLSPWQESFKLPAAVNDPAAPIRIGYFSGSPTHASDFSIASESLYRAMRSFSGASLVLAGFAEPPSYLLALGSHRIQQHPIQNSRDYFALVATCHINLAPLEDTPFNQGKSELKIFEAAALGIPTIASKTHTNSRCIINGVNGLLAEDSSDWDNHLYALLADPDVGRQIGKQAKATIATEFSFRQAGAQAEAAYRSLLA